VHIPTHEHQRSGRAPAAILVLAYSAIAVLVAACSSGPAGPSGTAPVASLPGPAATSHASGPLTVAQSDRDMIGFTRCMRGHGVQMPDPFHRPGHQGLSIDLPARDAASRTAYTACTHFIEPVIQMKQASGAARVAPQMAGLTRYAQCMRRHDISMLDPTPYGALSLGAVPGITGDFGRYSPQFRAADSACRHLLPAGVHDDGTGP
jgi:hypothetical protein